MDRIKVWKTVITSWAFTILGIVNMLVITLLVGIIAFRFTGPRIAISIMGTILILSLMLFLFSEIVVNIGMHAYRPDPRKHQDFISSVDSVCRKKRMWFRPRLYMLKLEMPNAMAYGWGFLGQYAIGITQKLYDMLDKEELKAVIAHEIAHIRCKDVGMITAISILTGYVEKLKDLFLEGKTSLGKGPFAYLFGFFLWLMSRFVFVFLRSAISQERELAADALGSSYVGSVDPLMSGLKKLAGAYPRKGSATIFESLFISHPSMDERIKSLTLLKKGDI